MTTLLSCQQLGKRYGELQVWQNINVSVLSGELVAVVGVSGSGKSTLLHCLGGLDNASEGEVHFLGSPLTRATAMQKNHWRQHNMGFVYQFHYLIAELTALENVALALMVAGIDRGTAQHRARFALEKVGLLERLNHRPAELSGGERQRVAVARAFVHQPTLILADEPTGNLDHDNALRVWDVLRSLCREQGAGLVVVTHDQRLAATCDRQFRLEGGALQPLADY